MEDIRIKPVWHKVTTNADLPIDVDNEVLLIIKSRDDNSHWLERGECIPKKHIYYQPDYVKEDKNEYVFEKASDYCGDCGIDYILVSQVLYWADFNVLIECPEDATGGSFNENHTYVTNGSYFID